MTFPLQRISAVIQVFEEPQSRCQDQKLCVRTNVTLQRAFPHKVTAALQRLVVDVLYAAPVISLHARAHDHPEDLQKHERNAGDDEPDPEQVE